MTTTTTTTTTTEKKKKRTRTLPVKYNIFSTEIDNDYLNWLKECYMEDNDTEPTREQLYEIASDNISMQFQDEEKALDRWTEQDIICIANLGLWQGRRSGYLELGQKLNEVFRAFQGDDYALYADRYNIRGVDYHHDGTNYYLFREWREGVNRDTFMDKILTGKVTSKDISRYTKSLKPQVAKIYEWTE